MIDGIVKNRLSRVPSSKLPQQQTAHCSTSDNEVDNILNEFLAECKSNSTMAPFLEECAHKVKAEPDRELQDIKQLLLKAEHSLSLSRYNLQRATQVENSILLPKT